MYKPEKLLSISFCDQCDFCSAQLSPWKPGRGQPTERRERMLGIKKRGKIRLRKSKREMVVATAFFFCFCFFFVFVNAAANLCSSKGFWTKIWGNMLWGWVCSQLNVWCSQWSALRVENQQIWPCVWLVLLCPVLAAVYLSGSLPTGVTHKLRLSSPCAVQPFVKRQREEGGSGCEKDSSERQTERSEESERQK